MSDVQLLLAGEPLKGRVILAHGSGMPMDHLFMDRLTEMLVGIGLQVIRFEFPYMSGRRVTGKRALPNPVGVLIECYKQVVIDVKDMSTSDNKPIFLAGKSLGGRVATLIADEICPSAVFVFGYPFHPVKKPEKLRTAHLAETASRIDIFQGSRDALGSFTEVQDYDLSSTVSVHWLEDGDHDLKPRKRSGYTQDQHLNSAITRIAEIVEENQV